MIKSFRGNYSFLSNFYETPVTYEGITYRNSEAAYQAAKTLKNKEKFKDMSGSEAKRAGRVVIIRNDWDEIKLEKMYEICLAKFTQNLDLKQKLLETENEYLQEENTWGDMFWGTVKDVGQNNLGKILMRVREELKHV